TNLHLATSCWKNVLAQRRKGAKRYRVSKGFLCAFAPLREKYFLSPTMIGTFRASPPIYSLGRLLRSDFRRRTHISSLVHRRHVIVIGFARLNLIVLVSGAR